MYYDLHSRLTPTTIIMTDPDSIYNKRKAHVDSIIRNPKNENFINEFKHIASELQLCKRQAHEICGGMKFIDDFVQGYDKAYTAKRATHAACLVHSAYMNGLLKMQISLYDRLDKLAGMYGASAYDLAMALFIII